MNVAVSCLLHFQSNISSYQMQAGVRVTLDCAITPLLIQLPKYKTKCIFKWLKKICMMSANIFLFSFLCRRLYLYKCVQLACTDFKLIYQFSLLESVKLNIYWLSLFPRLIKSLWESGVRGWRINRNLSSETLIKP